MTFRSLVTLLLAAKLLAATPAIGDTDSRLSYAGFNVDSTIEAAIQLYPNSTVDGSYIKVASADSDGLVRYVLIERGRVMLGLGSRTVGDAIKPQCFDVQKRLAATYGDALSVRKTNDGPVKMRVYLWTRGNENLELQCEELGRQLNGDRIELYRSSGGAT